MNGKDNRRAARTRYNAEIEICDETGEPAAYGRLIDYSAGGASFSVGEPLVMPAKFRARLKFPDRSVIEVMAHVVWTKTDKHVIRYGMKFDSLLQVRRPG